MDECAIRARGRVSRCPVRLLCKPFFNSAEAPQCLLGRRVVDTATGHDARDAAHWKRTDNAEVHRVGGYNKGWRYGRYRGTYGQYDYGVYYARPRPYTYIYRYQPYVYHHPRVYVRPEPRVTYRRQYWPRETWRRRYDRRPGVHYYYR